MKEFKALVKLSPGDQVAVISPSSGLAGIFPWVQDLGLQRLSEQLGLVAVEYDTTRRIDASLKDRADDIMSAFANPGNKAVIASIGGDDQIKLIKYLDEDVFLKNPKPFFGYSDNTHMHNFLWNLGIPSFYGGSILTQYGMHGSMYDETIDSLKNAFFRTGEVQLKPNAAFNDIGIDWSDKSALMSLRELEKNEGFYWDGSQVASGTLWGGCVESLIYQMTVGKYLPSKSDLVGAILIIETSEELPDSWVVEYLLSGFGERGLFDSFEGVLVGRPKAQEIGKLRSTPERVAYREAQRRTVIDTVRQYNRNIPIVQNLDFGHTDPQIIMPLGHTARIDPAAQKITLNY